MKNRIQKSMILVIVTTLLVAYAITIFFVYGRIRTLARQDVRYEAEYVAAAINYAGADYLKELDENYIQSLDEAESGTRITLIDTDGSVLYDTVQDEYTLENHRNRPEVQEALNSEDGIGEDVRKSDTVGTELFYCAKRLNGGQLIRVSKPVTTMGYTAVQVLPAMLIIFMGMLVIVVWISRRQAKALVEPINTLNLEDPLKNDVYPELSPLLHRIDEQNQAKDALVNMRKEFTANVSHELKTPLTSISGYAEIMRDGLVRSEDMPKFSDRIYKEANRLVSLVNDIIKLSRLDEGKVELEKEDVDLYALAREIVQRLGSKARECGVTVGLSGEACHVQGIRQILDEMIYNLTENAIKYNKKGGRVSIWVGRDLSGVKVVIQDTGIGIAREDQERIFERFYRVDKSHSKEIGGTGLGLSIVKHGAMLHGATIRVDSVVDEGTRMTLCFPNWEGTNP